MLRNKSGWPYRFALPQTLTVTLVSQLLENHNKESGEMRYRIVIRNLTNGHITPLTKYFDSREYALERMKESYSSTDTKLIYELQPEGVND